MPTFTQAMQDNLTIEEKARYGVPVTRGELQELADNQRSMDLLEYAGLFITAPTNKNEAEAIFDSIGSNARKEEKESFRMILEKITDDLNAAIETNTTHKGIIGDLENLLKTITCWQDDLQ